MSHTTRNAELTDFVQMLRDQHARRVDVVAPAATITARQGQITVRRTGHGHVTRSARAAR